MRNFYKLLLLPFIAVIVFISCEKEPILDIKIFEYTISEKGGTQQIGFSTNYPWKASINGANWISLDKSSGKANSSSFTVNIQPNLSVGDRQATISILSHGLSQSITIKQKQKDVIALTTKSFTVSDTAVVLSVSLGSNVEYIVNIPKAAQDWVSLLSTKSFKEETLQFNIARNNFQQERSVNIIIQHPLSSVSDTFKITQAKAPPPIVATPIITPKGGIYTSAQNITLSCATDGAEIRYTLDGKEPTIASTLYAGSISISDGATVKAKAFKTNWIDSATALEEYVFNIGAVVIQGNSNPVQHIDASNSFIFKLNNLDNKNVFFIFSNKDVESSTELPQIHSNVMAMKTVVKTAVYLDPSFVVSGTTAISEFNNNPERFPMKGLTKAEYEQHAALAPSNYELGSIETLYDDLGTAHISTVRKVISAHGKNLYVWVSDECWGPQSEKKNHVTQQMVDLFAPKFLNVGNDNDVYEWVTNICGEPWGPTGKTNLIPETDNIHIWLTDIKNDNKTTGTVTVGYFHSLNNYLKSSASKSNEKLMFVLDAVLFGSLTNGSWDLSHYWPMKLISTLSHEFTHMIYHYQKRILNGLVGNTAINEMCAQCVEDLVSNKILSDGPRGVAYITPNAGNTSNKSGRLPLYNANNSFNILNWSANEDESLINYSKTYALGAYLMRNYGGASLIRELIQNNSTGIPSIVNAVNSNGAGGLSYHNILQQFAAANLLSDNTTTTWGYKFNTEAWSKSTVNGITYNLGAINLYNYSPIPYIFNELPWVQQPGSNIFYRAGSNLKGTQEWSFVEMSPNTKLTVVIK